jgi:hypothetical protein
VKQAKVINKRSLLLVASIAPMALLVAAQCQGATASSIVSSITSTAPGGFIYDGTNSWVADAQLGLCQIKPGTPGKLINCVLPPTSNAGVPAIVGQPAFDPAGFAYLPDRSTASMGIWRYPFNIITKTFGAGVNIAATLGSQRPGAVAFGTDGNLYATMTVNSNIMRINTPAAATQTINSMATTISGQPAQGLAFVGSQLWVVEQTLGILDIVDPVGCGTKCRGAILTTLLGLTLPSSIAVDATNNYVYIGTPAGVLRYARVTGVLDLYSRSYLKGATPGLFSYVSAVGVDGAANLLVVDDPTAGQVTGGGTVYSAPFFVLPLSIPPVQSPPDGQGGTPQPPITPFPTVIPGPIANPASFYSTGLTTPRGAVFMGTHLWVVDAALGFCKVDSTTPAPSLTACATLPAGFVPGAPAYDPLGHLVYLPDTAVAGGGILRFPFNIGPETLGVSTTVVTAAKLAAAIPPATVVKGGPAPTSLALGPDNQLYVAMAGSTSILRVSAPATNPKAPAIHAITSIGNMFEGGSLGLAFYNGDLFDVETNDSSTLYKATLCQGSCTSLFLGVPLNSPAAVASDANFVYLGTSCAAADVATACNGGMVWRYDPVANTMQQLADAGLQNGVSTQFSSISGLAVDNLGQVTVVDGTTVWSLTKSAPAVTSLVPSQGPEGSTLTVTINGSGFQGSVLLTTCAAITPGNVTLVSPIQITATFAINPAGPLGSCSVTATTANGTTTATNFTIVPGSALSTITPSSGFRGVTVPVSIFGNALDGGTLNAIPGITFSGTVVTSTLITTSFVIDPAATLGARNIIVTTPGGTPSNALIFNVTVTPPVLTNIAPNTGAAGTTVPVTITGTALTGATLNLPPGFTLSGVPVVTTTSIKATLVIAATIAEGPQNITVTTLGGLSNALTFQILPALTTSTPNKAIAGTATNVVLAGTNLAGVTAVNAGANITVTAVVASAGQVTATFTTLATAPAGPQSITVTDALGTSNAVTFTILAPVPVLTSINPITGGTGATVPVTLTGTALIGATLNLPTGVSLVPGTLVNNSFTTVTASLLIAANAPLGLQTISVTTPGAGNTSNGVGFTIFALAPLLNSPLAPANATAGSTVPVTLTGTGFTGATAVNTSGAGITVTNLVVVSATQITATFVIAANAPTQGISVTTPNGTSNAVTFTVIVPVPTLISINPSSGAAGTASLPVTLTGTNLIGATAINTGTAGITVTNLAVVSATQVTATFAIAAGAAAVSHAISVVTPGGTTTQAVSFTVLPVPTLTSINPTSGAAGTASLPVTLTGTNLIGATAINTGTVDITVTNLVVVSATQVTAAFAIAAGAVQGNHAISVVTPGGTTTKVVNFKVLPPAPVITSLNNIAITKGTAVAMKITGTDLGNLPVGSVQVLLNGAPVNPTFVTITGFTSSQTLIKFNWTFTAAAPITDATDAYSITVTTPSGTSNASPFTVN